MAKRTAWIIATSMLVTGCGDAQDADDRRAPRPGPVAPTVVAAGDIACAPASATTEDTCRHEDTAALVERLEPDAVLTLGDLQYDAGSREEFRGSFDRTWGRLKDRLRPTLGNHEYGTREAAGYFDYFGDAAGSRPHGYYSFELGAWHVIALNSNCDVVDVCGAGSAQVRWLRRDLAASTAQCTLAFWHHPRFSSGRQHGNTEDVATLWRVLDAGGVDVALAGHDHIYERFAPQDARGVASPEGMRGFVVGTGGSRHYELGAPRANSEARHSGAFGVLELELRADRYDWRFVSIPGDDAYADEGTATCSGAASR